MIRKRYLKQRINEIHEDYQQKFMEVAEEIGKMHNEFDGRLKEIEKKVDVMSEFYENQVQKAIDGLTENTSHQFRNVKSELNGLISAYQAITPVQCLQVTSMSKARENYLKDFNEEQATEMVFKDMCNKLGPGSFYLIETGKGLFLTKNSNMTNLRKSNVLKFLVQDLHCKKIEDVKYIRARKDAEEIVRKGARLIDKDCNLYILTE